MTDFDMPAGSAPAGPLIRLIRDQRVAFLAVGVINTFVGFAFFIIASNTAGHVTDQRFGKLAGSLTTLAIAHVLGVLFAFVMHRYFVFRVRGHVVRDIVRFESVYLTGLLINAVTLPALVEVGLHRIPAQALILAASTVLSYFGHKHFTFRRNDIGTQNDHHA
ncbi:GtrA family protein [Mycobacterium kubicae]|uniref:GtrA family protein n=1 Tax=Mycobacterium kubicae TaxID=120959 RepID=UPI0008022469|nr:GtrA family protein [Mycobacterium kubicae]OBK43299.1 polysaccharide biosynthesis protein GtrA [Mycobacterium kubicae]